MLYIKTVRPVLMHMKVASADCKYLIYHFVIFTFNYYIAFKVIIFILKVSNHQYDLGVKGLCQIYSEFAIRLKSSTTLSFRDPL